MTNEEKTVPLRGVWMFGLPLAAALIIGYVFIRSQNRGLEMQLAHAEQKMAVLEGEVYRLKANLEERESELRYLSSPDLERYAAFLPDSGFVWLFFRESDRTWLAYTENMDTRYEELSLIVDSEPVGSFSRVADTSGLQRVGESQKGKTAYLIEGSIEDAAEANGENILVQVPL